MKITGLYFFKKIETGKYSEKAKEKQVSLVIKFNYYSPLIAFFTNL